MRISHLFNMYIASTFFTSLDLHSEVLLKDSGISATYRSDDLSVIFMHQKQLRNVSTRFHSFSKQRETSFSVTSNESIIYPPQTFLFILENIKRLLSIFTFILTRNSEKDVNTMQKLWLILCSSCFLIEISGYHNALYCMWQ